jgi:hypothetical protein
MLPTLYKLQSNGNVTSIVGSMPTGKVQLVKLLRDIFGLGLKEAKDMMDFFYADGAEKTVMVYHDLSADNHRKLASYGLSLVTDDFVYIVEQGNYVDSVFLSKIEAEKYADLQNQLLDNNDFDGCSFFVTKKIISRSADKLFKSTQEAIRQSAMSKLSAAEKLVLGLRD